MTYLSYFSCRPCFPTYQSVTAPATSTLAVPIRIAVETLADGSAHVFVRGEVDLATAPHLERVLADAIHGTDSDVLVEFSSDSFIDSTGLNVLIQAARRLRESDRALRVTTGNPHMRA